MKDVILILTNSKDGIHTDSVITKLSQQKEKFFRFDVDKIGRGELNVQFSAKEGGFAFRAREGANMVAHDQIKSVWYRRPNLLDLPIVNDAQREHAVREITAFLEGVWCCLENVFWMSSLMNIKKAHYKTYQLQIAAHVGLEFPPTLISNNPEEVREFCDQYGSVVFKTICHNPISTSSKTFGSCKGVGTARAREVSKLRHFLVWLAC